jgi:putative transposase
MVESNSKVVSFPWSRHPSKGSLEELLRKGAAHQLLLAAAEAEIAEYVDIRRGLVDGTGRQLVVRNGFLPGREIQTPLGDSATDPQD